MGGMGGGVQRVGWEVAKTLVWDIPGAAMMPTMTQWWAIESVGANPAGPHHPIGTLHWCHCSSRDFGGLENALQKTKPVNI